MVPAENHAHGLLCYSVPLGKGRLGLARGIRPRLDPPCASAVPGRLSRTLNWVPS